MHNLFLCNFLIYHILISPIKNAYKDNKLHFKLYLRSNKLQSFSALFIREGWGGGGCGQYLKRLSYKVLLWCDKIHRYEQYGTPASTKDSPSPAKYFFPFLAKLEILGFFYFLYCQMLF